MYLPNTSVENIIDNVLKLNIQDNETVVLFFGEETILDYQTLIDQLNTNDISFWGAFFPGIIYGSQRYTQGVVIETIKCIGPACIITDMGNASNTIKDWREKINTLYNGIQPTLFTFVDGLSPKISAFLSNVYDQFANSVQYIGGGAGSLSLQQSPCLITPKGLLKDAAILCASSLKIQLGVKHGWAPIQGPLVATRTEDNIIYELNWQNAFEVYSQLVNTDSNIPISNQNFFEVAKGYPFGIIRDGQEDIVRDPIAVGNDGELYCVGEVPSNSVLSLLKGEPDKLVSSAKTAAQNAINNIAEPLNKLLMIDCISRVLFLQDDFKLELNAVQEELMLSNAACTPSGVLSLGEISSDGNGMLTFYNKTMVIGALS